MLSVCLRVSHEGAVSGLQKVADYSRICLRTGWESSDFKDATVSPEKDRDPDITVPNSDQRHHREYAEEQWCMVQAHSPAMCHW
jgi:hypothetical protein